MHELSIAQALCDLVRAKAPAGAAVRALAVRAGPMRGIEREAMDWAWRAAAADTPYAAARLELELLPWQMHCPDCGQQWPSADLLASCACGCANPTPTGSDELTLQWIEVDDPSADS